MIKPNTTIFVKSVKFKNDILEVRMKIDDEEDLTYLDVGDSLNMVCRNHDTPNVYHMSITNMGDPANDFKRNESKNN